MFQLEGDIFSRCANRIRWRVVTPSARKFLLILIVTFFARDTIVPSICHLISLSSLPFTNSATSIKTFRQALALDERRVGFLPLLYEIVPRKNEGENTTTRQNEESDTGESAIPGGDGAQELNEIYDDAFTALTRLRRSGIPVGDIISQLRERQQEYTRYQRAWHTAESVQHASERLKTTDVREVWFAGCHPGT